MRMSLQEHRKEDSEVELTGLIQAVSRQAILAKRVGWELAAFRSGGCGSAY